ncbi:MAG: MoxR family ATPase [Lachnospiraceae bacterium]|nr:MoxR family ATPase [Lachnospiraceae bacterium]MDD3660470.1 MoxR family ATPase [Lachnospiraceae bacterium]
MNPDQIINNIEKVITGKHEVITLLTTALLAGGHVLLEDVPGVGKTTLARSLAKTIDCGFTRIQFTPDTLPSDITGLSVYNMKKSEFEFVEGAVMNHIILADEINRTAPKTQASLLEAMEEQQVTVDRVTYPLPAPFMIIATQNPVDSLGTYQLPEAQLDRFMMKLTIGYPDSRHEKIMMKQKLNGDTEKNLEAIVSKAELVKMQEEVKQVYVHDDLLEYVIEIMNRTRKSLRLSLGASPRATIMLVNAAQAYAYQNGRDFVIPEDIIFLSHYVIPHRFLLSQEGRINKISASGILNDILKETRVPVLE